MDDKEIKIDLSNIDMMLDRLANKMENGIQLDLDYDYSSMGQAGTISHAASSNLYPYVVTTGSGTGSLGISGNGTYSFGNINGYDTWQVAQGSPGLHVRGNAEFEGDVKINGKSISETLDKIEERLAILRPNKELEDKWEKLKELGDAYRALEKDIQEKEKIWETLKK